MKLIGKAKHDYYDSGAVYGIDDTHVLIRNPEVREVKFSSLFNDLSGYGITRDVFGNLTHKIKHKSKESTYFEVYMQTLFFCGTIYSVFRIREYSIVHRREVFKEPIHLCTIDEYVKFSKTHFKEPLTVGEARGHFSCSFMSKWATNFYVDQNEKVLQFTREYAEENKLPYFLICVEGRTAFIKLWPNLGELGLGRVKDAITCFNEIDFYMFSVLGQDKEIVQLNDIDKVAKKGFDTEYGFRTRPKDKKTKKS